MSVLRPGHRVPSSERAKVRLFAVDVDGTLLTSSHEVTDGVRAAEDGARLIVLRIPCRRMRGFSR